MTTNPLSHSSRIAEDVASAPPRYASVVALARRGLVDAFVIVAVLAPFIETDVFRIRILTIACLAGLLTVGATISLGFAGLFNMSQGTFYGIGAYTTALLVTREHASFEVAMLASVGLAAVAGALLGLTSLRVRGDLWALISMAFTVALASVFSHWRAVTNGEDGLGVTFQSFAGIQIASPRAFYYAALIGLAVGLVVAWRVRATFVGRAMLAVRRDESVARMMGVTPLYTKLLALGLAAALAGLAGSLLVATTLYITPESFDFLDSFNITLFAIVGEVASPLGGAAAAAILTFVTEAFRSFTNYRWMIYGVILILAIFVRSGVIQDTVRTVIQRLRGRRPDASV